MFIVYGLFTQNQLFYIGKTTIKRAQKRLIEHKSHALKNVDKHYRIYNKIRKILKGSGSIELRTLYVFDTVREQNTKEIELIKLYGIKSRNGNGILYNSTSGGEGMLGITPNEQTRFKMRIAKLGNKINVGKKRPDMVKRFSKKLYVYALDGTFISEFESARIAEVELNVPFKIISSALDNRRITRAFSVKHQKYFRFRSIKYANIDVYQKPTPKSKKVLQYTTNMTLIAEYKDAVVASKELGINPTGIRNVCNGKFKTSAGYIWAYAT